MKTTAGELAEWVGGRLEGRASEPIEGVAGLESAGPGDLSYAEDRFLEEVQRSGAACVIVPRGSFPGKTTIQVDDPKLAFVRAAALLYPVHRPSPGLHPTAIVAPDAEIGEGVWVGPHAVIESEVVIGPASAVHGGCRIGQGCRIGEECTFYPNVVLYSGVEIGNRVVVHAGAVIGSDGFGYVRDEKDYLKFPQIGRVILEDDVEIGANTTIDRGSLGSTVIGRGTKLDNLCHVAHNVQIGARTVIAAQTGISGSVSIGDDAVIAGQVGIADHVRIDSGAVVGAQCGIPSGKRIRAGEVFWGTPARPLKDVKVQQAYISRLPRLADELARLRKRVEELASDSGRG